MLLPEFILFIWGYTSRNTFSLASPPWVYNVAESRVEEARGWVTCPPKIFSWGGNPSKFSEQRIGQVYKLKGQIRCAKGVCSVQSMLDNNRYYFFDIIITLNLFPLYVVLLFF